MKRYLLLCLLIALLGACSKNTTDTPETPGGGNAVRFFTEVGTRGVNTTTGNISEFGVFCYDLKGTTWDPATSVPNKMNNLKVTRVIGTSDWTYGEPIDWEGGDGRRFSFTGYSPHATGLITVDNPTGNGIEVVTPAGGVVGIPTLNYETQEYVQGQVDLLVAKPHESITPQENVHMKFGHSLVRIGFTAYSAANYTTVQSIEIKGVPYKGSMKIDGTNAWTIEADTKNFTIDLNLPVPSADENNPTDLSAGSGYFMLLPFDNSTATTKATVTFNYTLGGVPTSYTHTFAENWQVGKAFTYKIDLGGVASEELLIKEVTIEDWNTLTSETLDPGRPDLLKFSITYDANKGLDAPAPQNDLKGGSEVSLSTALPTPPVRTTFIEWNTKADGTGTAYQPGQTFNIEDNLVLYAAYTPVPPYTVTFDANGGTDAPAPITEAAGGEGVVIPDTKPTPGNADASFGTWNTAADGTGTSVNIGDTFFPTENTTLYAIYDYPYLTIGALTWTKGFLVANGTNGCKIGRPQDGGLYFQIGSLIGWYGGAAGDGVGKPSNGAEVSIKVTPYEYAETPTWTTCPNSAVGATDDPAGAKGDPCRYYLGDTWRLPTYAELIPNANFYTSEQIDGISGRWAGPAADWNKSNSLFLAASGYRDGSTGDLSQVDQTGYLITSAENNIYQHWSNSGNASAASGARSAGRPVRCVRPIN